MEKKSGRTPREGIAAVNFNDIVPIGQAFDLDDTHVDVLGQKIVISVHRAKNTVTKIEGIPTHFSLEKLLKKLKAKDMLSCGGHVAKDKDTGSEFIVLQGSFSVEVAKFLTSEGIADADCIVCRG
jgi:translation initiation factor 1 (eIF-1/SUI1)